jgi:hypothetical protein
MKKLSPEMQTLILDATDGRADGYCKALAIKKLREKRHLQNLLESLKAFIFFVLTWVGFLLLFPIIAGLAAISNWRYNHESK